MRVVGVFVKSRAERDAAATFEGVSMAMEGVIVGRERVGCGSVVVDWVFA